MSFTGFPEEQSEDGERLTSGSSSNTKVKLGTNRRQKEKLMLAAANQKARSVIECSGDLDMLPSEARLAPTPTSSLTSPVKLKITGELHIILKPYCIVLTQLSCQPTLVGSDRSPRRDL